MTAPDLPVRRARTVDVLGYRYDVEQTRRRTRIRPVGTAGALWGATPLHWTVRGRLSDDAVRRFVCARYVFFFETAHPSATAPEARRAA